MVLGDDQYKVKQETKLCNKCLLNDFGRICIKCQNDH